jgi:septal ring factor EnvC (AmiA/AmiB activator)
VVLDPRVNQIQNQLAEQQKQIDGSREDLNKTREDLETKVNSTHDELSGSIARTHDELVELQKRGERNYYEFKLGKAKDFHRVGPFSVSLRKVNFKRKSYDLAMIVDDNQIQKKSVNLYEPVWIRVGDQLQPAELVVNQIAKNQIQGYISEAKYKQSASSEKNQAVTPQ